MKKSTRRSCDEQELRVRTPPKQHSPERITDCQGYDLLYEFLEALGIVSEFEKFYLNEVTFFDLKLLSEEDLIEMNISSKAVKKIIQAVGRLKNSLGKDFATSGLIEKKNVEKFGNLQRKLWELTDNIRVLGQALHTQQLEIINLSQRLSH